MYTRDEIKQLHKDFWTEFGLFCQSLARFKYRHKSWILYNTKIKGVELKFDATEEGAYVILELNNRDVFKRKAMMETLREYHNLVDQRLETAIWQDDFTKPCGTVVSRIYVHNPNLNIHKKEEWKDFFVYLSKNMVVMEKIFDDLKEQLEEIANFNAD